jgi:hypothetical protein
MKPWTTEEVLAVVRDLNNALAEIDGQNSFVISNNDFALCFEAHFGADEAAICFASIVLWSSGDGDTRVVDDDGEPTMSIKDFALVEYRKLAACFALMRTIGE